jgi:hypothetical protein
MMLTPTHTGVQARHDREEVHRRRRDGRHDRPEAQAGDRARAHGDDEVAAHGLVDAVQLGVRRVPRHERDAEQHERRRPAQHHLVAAPVQRPRREAPRQRHDQHRRDQGEAPEAQRRRVLRVAAADGTVDEADGEPGDDREQRRDPVQKARGLGVLLAERLLDQRVVEAQAQGQPPAPGARGGASGSHTAKVVPCPGVLSTWISPPWASTIW